MAEFALGGVKDLFKTLMAIMQKVETLRLNDEECRSINELVALATGVLLRLRLVDFRSHPLVCSALMFFKGHLDSGLDLVIKCQTSNPMRRFFTAEDTAKQLRRTRDHINEGVQFLNLAITASTFAATLEAPGTATIVRHDDGAHSPRTQPQDTAATAIYRSYSTTRNTRYGEDGAVIATMLATGIEASFAPSSSNIASSGLTEVTLSNMVAMDHISENISGTSHYIVKEIKIRVAISYRSRSKAMKVMAGITGVNSVETTAVGQDQIFFVVVVRGVQNDKLTRALRKKVGYAEIVEFRTFPAEEVQDEHGQICNLPNVF